MDERQNFLLFSLYNLIEIYWGKISVFKRRKSQDIFIELMIKMMNKKKITDIYYLLFI